MTGTNEKPQDAEQALTWALARLEVTKQNPAFLAEMIVTTLIMELGIELTMKEVDPE